MAYIERTVTTQAELDAALAEKADWVEIRSPAGVWLDLSRTGSASVRAYGSASVRASGSASVTAYGSASVTASGSASVTAYGSASVRASGSASVTAYDSASVTAYDSASVRAYGSASVRASGGVAIHLHSAWVKASGGVQIDHTRTITDPAEWCSYNGVQVSKAGVATVYKAVNDRWTTARGTNYSPGSKPAAPDWSDNNECGGGLHFSPTPFQALNYNDTATRFVEVGVRVADLRPIPGGTAKCKAPAVVRGCREVDIDGKRIKQ